MARGFFAHSADPTTWSTTTVVSLIVAALVVLLVIEHTKVKYGRLRVSDFRNPFAIGLTVAVLAVVAPAAVATQEPGEPVGLPDLISDQPFIWFVKNIDLPDGPALVMAFDGYLHNIGTGKLDLTGNPQIEDGVKQRVFDGEAWEEVGSPTVRFETDDGHNHFHLIRAADYALWDEGRTSSIGPASKVGFCLIDTEQIEELYDAFYDINDTDYCGVEKPDATFLSMGISPGWRDTYDANTTLQWVDISDIRPGRYWVTAETDPNNEILESNEDNNGLIFSFNKFAVPGHVARTLEPQNAGTTIELLATPYGTVGDRMFVIDQGPQHGKLDVPIGVDLASGTLNYVPEPGFVGEDTFSYYAHDVASQFPIEPTSIEVTVLVTDNDATDADSAEPDDEADGVAMAEIVGVDAQNIELYGLVEQQLTVTDASGLADPVRWYARDLPTGLQIDSVSGTITGVPTVQGEFITTVIVHSASWQIETVVEWSVTDPGRPTLHPINSVSTTSTGQARIPVGRDIADVRYEADGLPPGTFMTNNAPTLIGTPEEIGDFEVEIRELIDDQVTTTITVLWHVRPSVHPAFPL